MTFNKRGYYGGGKLVATGTDFTVHPQHGRIWSIDASVTGVNIDMPSATEFPYTGYAVLLIANVGSIAISIRDFSGTAITTVDPGEVAKLGLGDNTTDNGLWRAAVYAANSAAALVPAVHVVIGGNSVAVTKDDVEYYDVDLDSWTVATDIGASGVNPCAGESSAKAYSRQVNQDFREYVIDSWTIKATANSLQSAAFGCMSVGNKFHWPGRGDTGLSGVQRPEVWDQTDTWTLTTTFATAGILRHNCTETGPANSDRGWLYVGTSFSSFTTSLYIEYSEAADSYTDRTEIPGTNGGTLTDDLENCTMFSQEGTQIHCLGGDSGSGGRNDHDEYSIAGDSWAAETNYPANAWGVASNRFSDSDTLALLTLNSVGSSRDTYRWNNTNSTYTSVTNIGIYRGTAENAMTLLER